MGDFMNVSFRFRIKLNLFQLTVQKFQYNIPV